MRLTLLCAKECGDITLTSPVSGIVSDIHRGERRKIEFVSVIREGEQTQAEIESDGTLLSGLRKSGLFALMRQRPYDIVPDCNTAPRDIFVTAFDSAPLAPDLRLNIDDKYLESGLKALATLTEGKVYLCTCGFGNKIQRRRGF